MSDAIRIVRARQLAIRREIDRRGISLKVIAFDSGVKLPTLVSYFPKEGTRDPANIPGSAIYSLASAESFPDDLLSLLLPDNRAIVHVPDGVDHDDLAAACSEYLSRYAAARHPSSEAGIALGKGEVTRLDGAATVLRAVVAR